MNLVRPTAWILLDLATVDLHSLGGPTIDVTIVVAPGIVVVQSETAYTRSARVEGSYLVHPCGRIYISIDAILSIERGQTVP